MKDIISEFQHMFESLGQSICNEPDALGRIIMLIVYSTIAALVAAAISMAIALVVLTPLWLRLPIAFAAAIPIFAYIHENHKKERDNSDEV